MQTTSLEGVQAEDTVRDGVFVSTVHILNEAGAGALHKPVGTYVTLSLPDTAGVPEDGKRWCRAAADCIRSLLPPWQRILVAGLGNPAITPDSIGPGAADRVLATRHLLDDGTLTGFGNVSVLRPGVLGDTGMESAELIAAAARAVGADCILAMDALAAADPGRLCSTLQMTDTGIVPGSGVGNHRSALTLETMGVPVIALGVPTVIDAAAFSPGGRAEFAGLFVSPRDMDLRSRRISRLMGMAVNLALHPGVEEDTLWMLGERG